MNFIGVVGARKFNDRKAVEELVVSLPKDSIIVTSGCKGVCTWAKTKAEEKNLETLVYTPDLSNIRSRFEILKRYYQRNRELIERCDFVHAFISKEGGYSGGTRFEIEYAVKTRIPVKVHWEGRMDEIIYQNQLPFCSEKQFSATAWQNFFSEAVAF